MEDVKTGELLSLVAYGAICVLGGAALMSIISEVYGKTLNGSTIAAWLQAIGSLGAIFAVIEIARHQDKKSIQRTIIQSNDREKRLIRSLREEIEILWANYEQRIRPVIERMEVDIDGDESPMTKSVSNMRRFPIFEAAGGDIGLISDEKIRHATVDVYGRAHGLFTTLEYNGFLFEKILDAGEGPERARWQAIRQQYRSNIINAAREAAVSRARFEELTGEF